MPGVFLFGWLFVCQGGKVAGGILPVREHGEIDGEVGAGALVAAGEEDELAALQAEAAEDVKK